MGRFYLCGSKIQLVISDLKVAMLYFEQFMVAKVIYDVINHMNKYLTMYVNYDVDVCNLWRFGILFSGSLCIFMIYM